MTTPIPGAVPVCHINCNLNEVIDSTLVQELKEWSTGKFRKVDDSVQFLERKMKLEISLEWS